MLFQFPMENMNSGKGVPCRALEILTFMYDRGSGGQALPPSCEKRKRGKKTSLRCFFASWHSVKEYESYVSKREAKFSFQLPSDPLFKRHSFEALQRAGVHGVSQWIPLGTEREIITAATQMASDLFRAFSGLASVQGLMFDICVKELSVVRNSFGPETCLSSDCKGDLPCASNLACVYTGCVWGGVEKVQG